MGEWVGGWGWGCGCGCVCVCVFFFPTHLFATALKVSASLSTVSLVPSMEALRPHETLEKG